MVRHKDWECPVFARFQAEQSPYSIEYWRFCENVLSDICGSIDYDYPLCEFEWTEVPQ